ncbi:sulfate adenylyltransferase subunit CysN [Cytophaga hutchinsonii]|jgi:sulfate adenylyltransferase subunit 1|uniref:sulfate adenylyltransferase n=1 Tax=Cytophaga hutchinsonii (strain ATCC 33406 / DSM 1761 / CIP 103989 / NBRC 15051 / NCIMB 9469 / D465) TaxID=269798 RepID=A0A6N4SNS5_CYTH3|nr:sulfate adenylyltransferase subunit CysN [Cytophaga hutchinsonii]ABG57922.1 sulfate adenylyltransferase subunit 1 [Cytophaga hutchinsonii ATCC 33406]SFX09097.1 sulfate adenylyltransferase subunit 1 [Cytophaga hutchinsonii ATCC 33406]
MHQTKEPITNESYLNMDLLRFTTAGSVDDGKSTLIGRLLYDSKAIFEDQMEQIEEISTRKGKGYVDLSLLTDGLRAEREQGITIDVAYRYFATPKRKFIVADTPGHVQYTRNMVTGASTANLAIILIDARHGVIEQTCRHSFIASLLQIKHVVVCVNKMDLVDFSEEKFNKIREDYTNFASKLNIPDIRFIPISALMGDNVVEPSTNTPWYQGGTLMYTLETVNIASDLNMIDSRFPVQYVIRPQSDEFHDFRGFAGRIEGGVFKPGDEIMHLPSGLTTKIKTVETIDGQLEEAFPPMSVTMTLEDNIDISRGDMIVKPNNQPEVGQDIELMLCWLNEKKMTPGGKYSIKHTTKDARCVIKEVRYKMNINTLHKIEDDKTIGLNDIGRVLIRTTSPLFYDSYNKNRITGSVILVDEFTNETVGAGMIL